MKKLGLLLLACLIFSGSTFAQEYAVKQNKFKDNWFLEAPKIGANINIASDWKLNSGLKDVTSPYIGVGFGKYFNPQFGARIEVGGFRMKNYFETFDKSLKANYVQANFDILVNLFNTFGKFKEDRKFDLYGILGIGYVRHLGYVNATTDFGAANDDVLRGTKNYIVPRIALEGAFHVSPLIDLNLEVSGNVINGNFNNSKRKVNGYLNATVGVAYKFKKRGFEYAEVVEPGLVASLNDEINKQRGIVSENEETINKLRTKLKDSRDENEILSKKLAECEKCNKNKVNNQLVITYRIGKTEVSKEQLVSLYNVAQILKENPEAKVEIDAYADAQTGSAKRNKYLTEKRCDNIVKILTDNYGISKDRVITRSHGSAEQIYDNNEWNRVAVIIVK